MGKHPLDNNFSYYCLIILSYQTTYNNRYFSWKMQKIFPASLIRLPRLLDLCWKAESVVILHNVRIIN